MAACFCAGTLLRTPGGLQAIETLKVGDRVLSRDEHDRSSANDYKVVEEVFERLGRVWHLTAGGRLIRTTGEHPFQEATKGWIACFQLAAGDRLVCEDGSTVLVEAVVDTGTVEVVYNLRVADWHTYFVGGEDWGFSVWAHNAYTYYIYEDLTAATKTYAVFEKNGNGRPASINGRTITGSSRQAVVNLVNAAPTIQGKVDLRDPSEVNFTDWLNGTTIGTGGVDQLGQTKDGNHIASWPAGSPQPHAHHIVMKKGKGVEANKDSLAAQKILQSYGIDPIFGYQNLVWAPLWPGHTTPKNGAVYAKAVLTALETVVGENGNKSDIITALQSIAIQFINGKWK
ncbi:MAG: AHH domain-containing protein [Bacteroidales bacterium]|nr:AHH domain-containing protein [Bacteroidales bacterium]